MMVLRSFRPTDPNERRRTHGTLQERFYLFLRISCSGLSESRAAREKSRGGQVQPACYPATVAGPPTNVWRWVGT